MATTPPQQQQPTNITGDQASSTIQPQEQEDSSLSSGITNPGTSIPSSITTNDIQEAISKLMATDKEFLQKILDATVKPDALITAGTTSSDRDKPDPTQNDPRSYSGPSSNKNNPMFEVERKLNDDGSFNLNQSSLNLSFGQMPSRNNLSQTPFHSDFGPDQIAPVNKNFPGLNPSNKARPLDSDITTQGSLTREMRNELKGKDLATFIDKATSPLGVKFELPLISQSDPTVSASILLDSTYSFVSKVEHLVLSLKNYAMDEVFMIVETVKVNNPFTNNNDATGDVVIDTTVPPIDLLTNYSKLSASKVKLSCQAYFQYGDKVAIDNLMWSQHLILRSCSESLANTLNARLSILPTYQRGGPTAFMILAELMISSTDKSSNNVLNKLQYVKLSQYNENVEQAVAVLYANVQRLEACNKLPPNINYTLLTILQTSSVYAFRSHFQTLHSMDDPRVNDPHKILHEAVTRYRMLKDDDKWNPTVNQKQGSSYPTSFNPAPTPLSVPSKGPPYTHDRQGRPIDRVPPAAGESMTRTTNEGRKEYWCTDCGCWGSHDLAGHKNFKERFAFCNKKKGTAALSESPVANSETSTPAPSTTASSTNDANAEPRLRLPTLATANFTMGNF